MITPQSRIKNKLFYGWVIVIAFSIIYTIASGIRFSFGVFFKSLISEFGLTRAQTSGVYSIYMLFCCVFSIVSGWGADKFSPRILIILMGLFTGFSLILTSQAQSLWQLFAVFSLLLAMGYSGVFVVSSSVIMRWFDEKRGLAIGLTTSGVGLGTVIMAPFAAYLILTRGWRMSYVIMGIIAWVFMLPLAMLLKKDPSDIGLLPYGAATKGEKTGESNLSKSGNKSTGISLLQAFRTMNFWYLGFVWLLSPTCIFMVVTHIVPHSTDMGIPSVKAATILSVIGAMSIPGRLLLGRISDTAGRKSMAMACTLTLAGTLTWLVFSSDLWMFYLFALVFGFSWGGLTTVTTAMIADIFGLHSIGAILGTLSAVWFLGAAIGPVLGGYMYDINHNYSVAFLICVAAMIITTLLLALIKRPNDIPSPELN